MRVLRDLPAPARVLVVAVIAAGLAVLAVRLPELSGWSASDVAVGAGLAAAIVVSERFQLELVYHNQRVLHALTDALWTAALLLVSPSILIVASVAGVLVGQARQGIAPVKAVFNAAQDVLALSAAAAVLALLDPPAVTEPLAWMCAAAAMTANLVVNVGIMGALISLAEDEPFWSAALVPTGLLHTVGNIAIGILGALLWVTEPAALPLLAVPVILTYAAYRGWLQTIQERDWMHETAGEAEGIAASTDLTRRLEPRADGAVGELVGTLNHMLDRVETAFERERMFVRETSHELRTPITIARGHLEVLGPDPSPLELQETVAIVVDELDRIARLVEDMGTLARMEDPRTLRVDRVALDRFVADVATKALTILDGRLRVAPASQDASVRVDPQRMTQALINLLKNAEEHTSGDGPIDLKVVGEARAWRFEVADAGGGVAPGEEQLVFRPFVSRKAANGSGLGLAIVSGIARAHGGSAGVENRPGDGATFWVRIPR